MENVTIRQVIAGTKVGVNTFVFTINRRGIYKQWSEECKDDRNKKEDLPCSYNPFVAWWWSKGVSVFFLK
jgi:hypothetical protein